MINPYQPISTQKYLVFLWMSLVRSAGAMYVFDRRRAVRGHDLVGEKVPLEGSVLGACCDSAAQVILELAVGKQIKSRHMACRSGLCGTPWEMYQGKWKCGACKMPILICLRCQGQHRILWMFREKVRLVLCHTLYPCQAARQHVKVKSISTGQVSMQGDIKKESVKSTPLYDQLWRSGTVLSTGGYKIPEQPTNSFF